MAHATTHINRPAHPDAAASAIAWSGMLGQVTSSGPTGCAPGASNPSLPRWPGLMSTGEWPGWSGLRRL
jgi:hypothetical protein